MVASWAEFDGILQVIGCKVCKRMVMAKVVYGVYRALP